MGCFGTFFTHFTYVPQPGVGWGGVGWGAMTCTVMHTYLMLRNCTCAHARCYAITLAHMFDATQLHLRTCSMLRNYTCAHVRCYAITLSTYLMLRNCTCAHARCYAITLAHMFDACHAITLAHMFDATQLHLRTCSMLRNYT